MKKEYQVPMPKQLLGVTPDDILADSRYGIGLMNFFFNWSGELLQRSWPGSRLDKHRFEDHFHDALEIMLREWGKEKIKARSAPELYCFVRTIFRNLVYANSLRNRKIKICADEITNRSAENEYDASLEASNVLQVIDEFLKMKRLLPPREFQFWNELKVRPDKKEKKEVMRRLNISSDNYDTTKFRTLRKVAANLKEYLF